MTRLDRAAHKLAEAAAYGLLLRLCGERWQCRVCGCLSLDRHDYLPVEWHDSGCPIRKYREARAATKKGRTR